MAQETHFQLRLLSLMFVFLVFCVIFLAKINANDIVMTAIIGMATTVLGYIGAIITKDRPSQRSDDPKTTPAGPENRTLGV